MSRPVMVPSWPTTALPTSVRTRCIACRSSASGASAGEDAAEAVAWTLRNIGRYGGNPQRVFVMGHSAGAHIALLLTLDRRYLAAAGVSADDKEDSVAVLWPSSVDERALAHGWQRVDAHFAARDDAAPRDLAVLALALCVDGPLAAAAEAHAAAVVGALELAHA